MFEKRDIPLVLFLALGGLLGWLARHGVLTYPSSQDLLFVDLVLAIVWLNVSGRVDDGFHFRRHRG